MIESFSYLPLVFGYLVLGKDTKNTAGLVIMKKNLYLTHLQDACEGGNTRAPTPSSRAPRAFLCARHNSYAPTTKGRMRLDKNNSYPSGNQCFVKVAWYIKISSGVGNCSVYL